MNNTHSTGFAACVPRCDATTRPTATHPSSKSSARQRARAQLARAQRTAYHTFLMQNGAHMHVAPVQQTAQGNLFCEWSEQIANKMSVVQEYRTYLQSQQLDSQVLCTPVYVTADNKLICDYPRRE